MKIYKHPTKSYPSVVVIRDDRSVSVADYESLFEYHLTPENGGYWVDYYPVGASERCERLDWREGSLNAVLERTQNRLCDRWAKLPVLGAAPEVDWTELRKRVVDRLIATSSTLSPAQLDALDVFQEEVKKALDPAGSGG